MGLTTNSPSPLVIYGFVLRESFSLGAITGITKSGAESVMFPDRVVIPVAPPSDDKSATVRDPVGLE